MNLSRNIPLMYVLCALENAIFWSAIWVLFYLRFTNYAGIGLIETVMILVMILGEIPTGAIADLLGKKRALIVGFSLVALGNIWMSFTTGFNVLVWSVFVISFGTVLRSGTNEALIYDSLLYLKAEKHYPKVLANRSTIKMLTIAAVSILGGYMYHFRVTWPFVAVALANLLGVVLAMFLTEPPIDTDKFSLKNYWLQSKNGVRELFRTRRLAMTSLFIILLSGIIWINGISLIDIQVVARGWDARSLGIIFCLMFVLSAAVAQAAPLILRYLNKLTTNLAAAAGIAMTMITVPFLGAVPATIILMLRNGLIEIFGNSANDLINQNVSSKYRATALSTYSMLGNLPYAFTAIAIGVWMDRGSVDLVASVLGYMLLVVCLLAGLAYWRTSRVDRKG